MYSKFYADISREMKRRNDGKYPEEYISPVVGSEEMQRQLKMQQEKKKKWQRKNSKAEAEE
ncbi:MAG: hypothetical protein IJ215_05150 [Clostridia bacterium]|nr:hypothetical protein [Clostridia bacterium]